MSRFPSKLTASAVALALCLAPAWTGGAAQAPQPAASVQSYVVIDLTPAGSATSSAAGAAGAQQVGGAGFAASAGQPVVSRAVLWNGSASGAVDLGAGTANAVGDGQQVGSANNRAALWLGTAASRIDLHPSQWGQSFAAGVGGGRQVGWATRSVPCTTKKGRCSGGEKTETHPFLWSGSAASAVDLTPFGLGFSAGRALGTDGVQQVGFGLQALSLNSFGGPFAVVWTGTADSAVNLNPLDSGSSQANAVSGGQQVGFGYFPHRALLWRGSAESVVDLHPADVYAASEANATNGVQQAGSGFVGDPFTSEGHSHALVWTGSAESVVDLNQFLPPGYTDAAATGIDAAGNVVGWASRGPASDPANVHAVMWKPVASGAVFARSLALNRSSVVGGDAVQATVTLSQPAPQGGAVVTLTRVIPPTADGSAAPLTVEMPSVVNVVEGATSASFDIATNVTTLSGFGRALLVDVQATYGGTTPTATLTVAPPLFLSSLSVAPGSVAGGAGATASITLSGVAPAGGALVSLTSDSPAAVVPPSVLVPAGQSGVTFGVRTNVVTASTTATLAATYGSSIPATGTARLVVNPPPAQAADTVAIQKALYVSSKRQLSVEATGSNSSARLTVYAAATGQTIGVLANRGGGRYEGVFNVATNPQSIVVKSSLGGSAGRAVTLK